MEEVYAVSYLTPGHNQIPTALGDGAKAGISIHFALRDFPREPETIEEAGPVRSEEVPDIPDELLKQALRPTPTSSPSGKRVLHMDKEVEQRERKISSPRCTTGGETGRPRTGRCPIFG